MRRVFIKRHEIVPVDSYTRHFGFITYGFDLKGSKDFQNLLLKVISSKTNKVSRHISAKAIEIENVSGIYYLLHTDKKIRSKEYVTCNNKKVTITPIGRLKYDGLLICKVVIGDV